jgi:hypothetical protein
MSGTDQPQPPPRLVPGTAFPPYSYVTGRFPHPTRDPAGHSYGHPPPNPAVIDPARWLESQDYLWGCDLFNHGYYWEAHEAWEGLWQACGRRGIEADFLKGLIKLAAAGVKCREGRADGVRRHAARAAELFGQVRSRVGDAHHLGLDVDGLIETARRIRRDPPKSPVAGAAVEVVFDVRLLPDGPRS